MGNNQRTQKDFTPGRIAEAREYFHRGIAHSETGQWPAALTAFQEAVRLSPGYPEAHYGLGVAFLAVRDLGGAWNQYKILKELNKSFAAQLLDLFCLEKPDDGFTPPRSRGPAS